MSRKSLTGLNKQMLIDGDWVGSNNHKNVINPYNGESVGSCPIVTENQAISAIDAADAAFNKSNLSAYDLYELLSETAQQMEKRSDKLSRILTSEQGKPIEEARGEVDGSIQTMNLSAEEAKRMFGEYIPMDAQKGFTRDHSFTQHEPIGVVAAITPFNFPLSSMAHKIGPALAAGNSVVAKPATNTPLIALALFKCLDDAAEEIEADVPDGLFNIITGSGSSVGDIMIEHEAIEAISFTGSTNVGEYIANNSGTKEVMLELGGNDPTIIWEDTDIEQAAAQAVGSACGNAGQCCCSVERVIVPEEIEDEVVDNLVDASESLSIGDPFEPGTDISSMVDDSQFKDVVDIFERTIDAGATVECGGNYGGDLGERMFEPTVLSGVEPDMPAATEETFGPLVPVIGVENFDEAIEEANNTIYGLSAGIFTQDIDLARRAANEINAGEVNVNMTSWFRTSHMPYGGFKKSGNGKEGVKYAVEHYSRSKLVAFHDGFLDR